MKIIKKGETVIYNGMEHVVILVFEFKGDMKVELKNKHNGTQLVVFLQELDY